MGDPPGKIDPEATPMRTGTSMAHGPQPCAQKQKKFEEKNVTGVIFAINRDLETK
jgi:hypothetical protein